MVEVGLSPEHFWGLTLSEWAIAQEIHRARVDREATVQQFPAAQMCAMYLRAHSDSARNVSPRDFMFLPFSGGFQRQKLPTRQELHEKIRGYFGARQRKS